MFIKLALSLYCTNIAVVTLANAARCGYYAMEFNKIQNKHGDGISIAERTILGAESGALYGAFGPITYPYLYGEVQLWRKQGMSWYDICKPKEFAKY